MSQAVWNSATSKDWFFTGKLWHKWQAYRDFYMYINHTSCLWFSYTAWQMLRDFAEIVFQNPWKSLQCISNTVKLLNKCCTVKPLWYRRQREGVECLYYGGVHITVSVLKERCAWNSRMSWEAQSAKCKQQSCTVLTKKLPWQWCSTGWD